MARRKPTFAEAMQQRFERPWVTRTVVRAVDDNDSRPVNIVWSRSDTETSPLPPFPFHIYVIREAGSLQVDEVLCDKLICYINYWQSLCDPCWHLEVYASIQDNVFACVEHHEGEKGYRRGDVEGPYMPDKNCFLVVDSEKWEEQGLLSVEYTTHDTYLPYHVNAERYRDWESLASHLRGQWADQGMTTVEELLDEKNAARGWPINLDLYDENGPDQRVNGMDFSNDRIPQAQLSSVEHRVDLEAMLDLQDVDVDGVVEEQREDLGGAPYTALRHGARQGPTFTFCLFLLGHDIFSKDRLAIFARLNTGLLAGVSWSLHLYSGATMSPSFSTFSQEMKARRDSDTPRDMPSSYAGFPLQTYQDVYMCLDSSKPQSAGPSFVVSAPVPDPASLPQSDGTKFSDKCDSIDITTFHVGSWDLVADMLHTYLAPLPHISLRISVQSEYSSDPSVPSPIKLELTSHAPEPITLNVRDTIFDTTHWSSCVRIVNSGSSVELPRSQSAREPPCTRSLGPQLLDYGFAKRVLDNGEDRPPHLVTLHPDVPVRLPVQRPLPADMLAEMNPDEDEGDRASLKEHEANGEAHSNPAASGWRSLYKRYEGSWEVGKKYAVELRDGTMIPRWTWGTEEELKGPYGLPALAIEMEEDENREFVLAA